MILHSLNSMDLCTFRNNKNNNAVNTSLQLFFLWIGYGNGRGFSYFCFVKDCWRVVKIIKIIIVEEQFDKIWRVVVGKKNSEMSLNRDFQNTLKMHRQTRITKLTRFQSARYKIFSFSFPLSNLKILTNPGIDILGQAKLINKTNLLIN